MKHSITNIVPGTAVKLRMLTAIYEKPGTNLTALIQKVRTSPNTALAYVNLLFSSGLIREERTEGRKKIHVRNLWPSFASEIAKLSYSMVEMEKTRRFFERYKSLRPYWRQMEEALKGIDTFVLIYGSYARHAATKDSDLDMILVGTIPPETLERVRELLVTFDKEISLKAETKQRFLNNKNKPLYQNIIKEHVIVFGAWHFLETRERMM